MTRAICLIQGHPDPAGGHFINALADAYEAGACKAGHAVHRIDVADMEIPFLRNAAEFAAPPPPAFLKVQEAVKASEHLVFVYPLWAGTMPALLKAFLEQLFRAEFGIAAPPEGGWPERRLKGRSARIIVTMGMPALAYRVMFGAHGVRGLEQSILGLAGVRPIRETLLGLIDAVGDQGRARMLAKVRELGRQGA